MSWVRFPSPAPHLILRLYDFRAATSFVWRQGLSDTTEAAELVVRRDAQREAFLFLRLGNQVFFGTYLEDRLQECQPRLRGWSDVRRFLPGTVCRPLLERGQTVRASVTLRISPMMHQAARVVPSRYSSVSDCSTAARVQQRLLSGARLLTLRAPIGQGWPSCCRPAGIVSSP